MRALLVHAALGALLAAVAQPAAQAQGIYTCIDDKGRKLTSDRPIAECVAREQRVLNRDGSVNKVVPPTLTAEERAAKEQAELNAALERAAAKDAVRRDRNLINRYPNEAAHRKARGAALDTVRQAAVATEQRVKELAIERKPLDEEAEFYKGKTVPARLKIQLDGNDVAVEAQRSAVTNQAAELKRINALYDLELERLKKLWAGAQPGSVGPATPPTTAPPAQAVNRAPLSATR